MSSSLDLRRGPGAKPTRALSLACVGLAAAGPVLTGLPLRAAPGAVVRLTLDENTVAGDSLVIVSGSLGGEPLHFRPAEPRRWHAIGAIPVDASGSAVARAIVRHANGRMDTLRVSFTVPKLPSTTGQPLAVDTQFTRPLDSATQARIARENERARDIGRHAHETPPLWSQAFLRPRASVITGPFGAGRLFNGTLTSQHLGVDFRGAVGDPIVAANRGVVALVDTFFLAGTVVYINHGGGVVTGYFHMSKPLVAIGDTVARGQQIGLVGASGRVTGPHLHWSARFGTLTINALDLVGLDPAWYGARPTAGRMNPYFRP